MTTQDFISKAKFKHRDRYDYSLVEYTGTFNKVIIVCKEHGEFLQRPNNHLNKQNCPKCAGKIPTRVVMDKNTILPKNSKAIILANGKYVLIDEEDYERANQYNWYLQSKKYASTRINSTVVLMHRFILGVTDPNIHVDHIFHNTLDNRKSQLRICTRSQNQMNRAPHLNKFKGVYWIKARKKWRAEIKKEGIKYHLGYFLVLENAARAYDTKAKELHKEFAYLNFPSK